MRCWRPAQRCVPPCQLPSETAATVPATVSVVFDIPNQLPGGLCRGPRHCLGLGVPAATVTFVHCDSLDWLPGVPNSGRIVMRCDTRVRPACSRPASHGAPFLAAPKLKPKHRHSSSTLASNTALSYAVHCLRTLQCLSPAGAGGARYVGSAGGAAGGGSAGGAAGVVRRRHGERAEPPPLMSSAECIKTPWQTRVAFGCVADTLNPYPGPRCWAWRRTPR
jgi:hypothetical protein